jgi:hypothetical protein
MPSAVGTGSGTDKAITTEYMAMTLDCTIELFQDCLGVTGDLLPKGDDAATSRAPVAIVPSYLQPTALTIAGLHGSRRAATLPTKAVEAPRKAAVAMRALVAYSPQTGVVLDMADELLGVAVSVSVHHAAADDQTVWRLMVVLVDNEFTQRVLIIVAPNLLVANTTVWPNIGISANLHIKYVGYFKVNLRTMGKFGLSTASIMSVFVKFTVQDMLDYLQLLPVYSSMMTTPQ